MFDLVKTFQCPNCREYINDSMEKCRYCSAPLDKKEVAEVVAKQEKLNNAFSSANSLRLATGGLPTFALVSFAPFLGFFAGIGFLAMLIILPFLLIYWQIKYGTLITADKEYKLAKSYWNQSLGIWAIFAFIQTLLLLLSFA
jgi:hypothetical protein